MGPIIISSFPSFPMCMIFTCMATSVYMWRSLTCFQPYRPSYPPPSAPTHRSPSQPIIACTITTFSYPSHHSCGFSPIAWYTATMCYIPHYFPVLATLRATISISNSTVLFPGHPSSILIVITIVGDRQLLHNAPLQCCSSTQDCYAPLPHHHRPSPPPSPNHFHYSRKHFPQPWKSMWLVCTRLPQWGVWWTREEWKWWPNK